MPETITDQGYVSSPPPFGELPGGVEMASAGGPGPAAQGDDDGARDDDVLGWFSLGLGERECPGTTCASRTRASDELLDGVRALFRRRKGRTGTFLTFRDVEADPAAKRAGRGT